MEASDNGGGGKRNAGYEILKIKELVYSSIHFKDNGFQAENKGVFSLHEKSLS